MEDRAGVQLRPGVRPGCLLIAVLSVVIAPAHGQPGIERTTPYAIDDPKYVTMLVAKIGDIDITAQQFLLSYEFGPAFVKRQKDSRRRYLDFMVNEKLLALDAYAKGFDRSMRAREALAEIEGDLATEELYRDDVLSRVKISRLAIAEGMKKEQIHAALQWLYSPTRHGTDFLEQQLASGVPFDSLFERQFSDSVKRDDRSLESTMFMLEMKNPDFARIADSLREGMVSGPVRGPDGWYIIRMMDEWKDALTTESEDMKTSQDVERALTKKTADSLSAVYVRKMMLGRNPIIQRDAFDLLGSYLGRRWLSPDVAAAWGLGTGADSTALPRFSRKVLVAVTNGSYSVGDFLQWYRAREYAVKLRTTSRDAYFTSLEELVWHMVRDRLLTARALSRNLQSRPSVLVQKNWWEEKILFDLEKDSIARTIPIDTVTLRQYYYAHRRAYRGEKGDTLTFVQAKEDVQRDMFTAELTQRLFHRIVQLKRAHPVEIHEDVLKSLPVDDENNPRAIELYVVKNGGTFPRQAFPTIDFLWQTWN